jgi:hypothetical protein
MQDLRIRALDGSILMDDGRVELASDDPAFPPFEPPPGAVLGFRFPRANESGHLHVYDRAQRESDGFYSCPRPLLTVTIRERAPWLVVPDEWTGWMDPGGPIVSVLRGEQSQFASLENARFEARRCEQGVGVRLHGDLAVRSDAGQQPVAGGRFRAELIVPWPYIAVQRLVSVPGGSRAEQLGPWSPGSAGIAELAVDSFGQSFFQGALHLGERQSPHFPPGPFVKVFFAEDRLVIMNAGRPIALGDGFAGETGLSGGPQLTVPLLGCRQWERMLAQADDATIEMTGPGIGEVDGRTGWVYESGGPATQQVTALKFRIRRQPNGLLFNGSGELAPLAGGENESLGPGFAFEFKVPLAYLKMRGIQMPRYLQERRSILADDSIW